MKKAEFIRKKKKRHFAQRIFEKIEMAGKWKHEIKQEPTNSIIYHILALYHRHDGNGESLPKTWKSTLSLGVEGKEYKSCCIVSVGYLLLCRRKLVLWVFCTHNMPICLVPAIYSDFLYHFFSSTYIPTYNGFLLSVQHNPDGMTVFVSRV